jgi:hypothetical protein
MPVRTTFAQKLASTLMQSGQKSCSQATYGPTVSCLCGEVVRVDIWVSNALCATLSYIFLSFPVYIYVNNGAK